MPFFSAFWTELCSANTSYQQKDDLHLIWYRLLSVAVAMFHHTFLVLQTDASQASQKVIQLILVKSKLNRRRDMYEINYSRFHSQQALF